MNGILLTFTLILLYSLISWVGAPQGSRTYGTTTWSFSCFPNFFHFFFSFVSFVLPVASNYPTILVILSAAFKVLLTASEVFSATSKALTAASDALSAASDALSAASEAL